MVRFSHLNALVVCFNLALFLKLSVCLCTYRLKGYGDEDGLFCGVFDGHGRNGHSISKFVRDYLPSLTLGERNSLQQAKEGSEFTGSSNASSTDGGEGSSEMLDEWNEACVNAFRAMDQELVLKLELDCTYSGTTAVSIIKQALIAKKILQFP